MGNDKLPVKARKKPMRRLEVAHATKRAVKLRLSGMGVVEIGEQLKVSHSRVSQMIGDYLAKTRENIQEKADELLQLDLSRLDSLLVGLWPTRKAPKTAQVILNVMERRARLLGLDAPSKVDLNARHMTGIGVMGSSLDLSQLNDVELEWLELILEKAGPQSDLTLVPEARIPEAQP